MRIRITEEYKEVQGLIDTGSPVTLVTGKAGTGKSTLIQHIHESFDGNCVVLAPTGVAAMNVGGATIHSFFRLPPRMLTDEDVKEARFKKPYKNVDLLIVDEISMVRADVLDAMDLFLRINGPHRKLPFGGVQLLMVGDLHQLPPVVKSREEAERFTNEYHSPFFFDSRVFGTAKVSAVELTHIFRQKDSNFVDILNDVRHGAPAEHYLHELNRRVTPRVDSDRETVLTTTNAIADRTNRRHLAALPGDRRTYSGTAEGSFAATSDRLPSPLDLMLKPDARVMFTKNDPDGRWVNGTLGMVMELNDRSVEVKLDETGDDVEVEKATWETYRYEYDEDAEANVPVVSGMYRQFPLMPAWAITIHKSQGKTLSAARVDLGRTFAAGQVYVALSRCRKLEDLTLSRPITENDVFSDPRVTSFYDSLFEATR